MTQPEPAPESYLPFGAFASDEGSRPTSKQSDRSYSYMYGSRPGSANLNNFSGVVDSVRAKKMMQLHSHPSQMLEGQAVNANTLKTYNMKSYTKTLPSVDNNGNVRRSAYLDFDQKYYRIDQDHRTELAKGLLAKGLHKKGSGSG